MAVSQLRDASFVVRIWWEYPTNGAPLLRGRVEHAPSGEAVYFEEFQTLVSFLYEWSGAGSGLLGEKRHE